MVELTTCTLLLTQCRPPYQLFILGLVTGFIIGFVINSFVGDIFDRK